ncbi:MAG: UDP-N-acetylmuramate dehydrogenase [Tissierellia bacterium]|nr:UDP-N-acetylmuramate dehydrogenase [Tissierellia bacterium]
MYDFDELLSGRYGKCLLDEPMAHHTTFRVGGPADLLIMPNSEEDIIEIVKYCDKKDIPFIVIGNGSNLLVTDKGIRGLVIKLGKNFSDISFDGNKLVAQAGALLSTVAKKSFKKSLTGMEEISGIPGSIGGAIMMNAGAYGGEISFVTSKVRCLDKKGQVVEFTKDEMEFAYRQSVVSKRDLIVLDVEIELEKGDYQEIEDKFKDYDNRRTSKQPLDRYSAGSTFKRPEGHYASKLIDEAGLRGFSYKRAQVSEKHCGFIINTEDATYEEIMTLIGQVQDIVKDKFGVSLETEVKIIGEK